MNPVTRSFWSTLTYTQKQSQTSMVVRIIIIVFFLIVVATLFQGLYFLLHDRGDTKRTVRTLTIRISLSVALFILLLALYAAGLLHPQAAP